MIPLSARSAGTLTRSAQRLRDKLDQQDFDGVMSQPVPGSMLPAPELRSRSLQRPAVSTMPPLRAWAVGVLFLGLWFPEAFTARCTTRAGSWSSWCRRCGRFVLAGGAVFNLRATPSLPPNTFPSFGPPTARSRFAGLRWFSGSALRTAGGDMEASAYRGRSGVQEGREKPVRLPVARSAWSPGSVSGIDGQLPVSSAHGAGPRPQAPRSGAEKLPA